MDIKSRNSNNNKKTCANSQKLNNSQVNQNSVKTKIKKEIKNVLDLNENKYKTFPNLQDTMKVILRGKFIELRAYIKNKIKQKNKKSWRNIILVT